MCYDFNGNDLPPGEIQEEESVTDKMWKEALDLKEYYLIGLNEKPINENEEAAWSIIRGAVCAVLRKDPKWHFFYENHYNIIRCSQEFGPELEEYLTDSGVEYKDMGLWADGVSVTRNYQHIFCPMFHTFSMMAVNEYNWHEIYGILDRVIHCFMNHQYFVMKPYRDLFSDQSQKDLWEARLIGQNAVERGHYIGYGHGINLSDGKWRKYIADEADKYDSKLGWFRKFIKKIFRL